MADVQRRLEQEEGVKLHRAQGRMEQLKIQDRFPDEVEYIIRQYEEIERQEQEARSAR